MPDLRFALRLLWKDRWFTAAAATALALGIGVNTTVFTFVNAVLLRGLPFPDSDRLVFIGGSNHERQEDVDVSRLDLDDWRRTLTAFDGLEAWANQTMNLSEAGRPPERARGAFLTAGTFRLIGQPPLVGRSFTQADGLEHAAPVVILGHALWKNRYGSDPAIVGRVVRINETPATVIGVMPEGMKFPVNAEMWQAWRPTPADAKRDTRQFAVVGRLKAGRTIAQAQAELDAVNARLAREFPATNKGIGAVAMTFNDRFNGGPIKLLFLSLMGAVGFVLLIACANVANLLLARSVHRTREIAVRVALGAGRSRIIRQLLVESVLLSSIGGVLGLGLAVVGVRLFDAAVANVGKPYWIRFTPDWTVIAFLAAVSMLTGLVFGLAPALQVSKTNVNDVLKEGGRGHSGGARARRFTSAMVVAQLALTMVLLTGAGLMVRSFLSLYRLDVGVETRRILTMRLTLAEKKYPTPESRRQFFERLEAEFGRLGGATAALATDGPGGFNEGDTVEIEGQPPVSPLPSIGKLRVSDRYFDAIGAAPRRGRAFEVRDGLPGLDVTVVNERFATRFFPREDPLGRRIRLSAGEHQRGPWLTIVGVAPNVRQGDPRRSEFPALVYVPWRRDPPSSATLVGRAAGDASSLASPMRAAVQTVDADLPVFDVQSLDARIAETRWAYRVFGSLFAIFAAIALLLSSIGVYAVMAYSVAQRRPEIGVRMALGASARNVAVDVLRGALLQLALGLGLGLAGAWGVSRLLSSVLVDAAAADPLTFLAIVSLLVTVTLLACLVPTRRATKVDPLTALRS